MSMSLRRTACCAAQPAAQPVASAVPVSCRATLQMRHSATLRQCAARCSLSVQSSVSSSRVSMKMSCQSQSSRRAVLVRYTGEDTEAGAPHSDMPLAMSQVSVEEIMTPHPVVFHMDDTIKAAARLMVEKDVPGGPVVDDEGNLLGVLTEDDIMWKGAGSPMEHYLVPPVYIGAFDLFFFLQDNVAVQDELRKVLAKRVMDAMTTNCVSIVSTASMADASRLMLTKKVNSLPVVDGGKKVVGVVTRHDVLRALIASHSALLE